MANGTLKGKTIVFGVTGGIAAYKTPDIVRGLIAEGASVHVVMTKAAHEFVTPLTLQTVSGNTVHSDMFSLADEIKVGHISLADRADLVFVAPASANILAEVAHGFCNELLTTVICATRAPVLFAPSMNVNMWENKITQENVAKLKGNGYLIVEPAEGELACGYSGKGRLPEKEVLLNAIKKILTKK